MKIKIRDKGNVEMKYFFRPRDDSFVLCSFPGQGNKVKLEKIGYSIREKRFQSNFWTVIIVTIDLLRKETPYEREREGEKQTKQREKRRENRKIGKHEWIMSRAWLFKTRP